MPVKDADILKHLLLKEEENETLPQGFEDDPVGFILKKYPGLNSVMEYMMTESFREYVDAIFIVAPKPTTFKVMLHNGQFFFLEFMGRAYQATVLGKNYYLMSIGEKERCMRAIARLLRYGNPMSTKGPEGAEQGTRPEGETGGEGGEAGGGGGEAAPAPPETGGEEGGEETVTESRILEEILKKGLFEDSVDSKNSKEPIEWTKTLTVEDLNKPAAIEWIKKGFKTRGELLYYFIANNKALEISKNKGNPSNYSLQKLTFKNENIKSNFKAQNYTEINDDINIFKDDKNNEYSISNVVKTENFRGVPKGKSTRVEASALKKLDEQIKKAIQDNGSKPIRIKIGKTEYNGITGIENQPGTPKSDFNLMKDKEPKVFISHKKEGGSKSFFKWGGFNFAYKGDEGEEGEEGDEGSDGNNPDPEVLEFIKNIESKVPDKEFKSGYSFAQKIKSDLLKNRIVFGKEFGGEFSKNNVNVVLQGDIDLVKIEDDLYELEVEEYWLNGDTPKGEYEPVLEAHYRDKSSKTFGFTNCEAFARPVYAIPTTTVRFTSNSPDQVWEPKEPKKPSIEKKLIKINKDNYKKTPSGLIFVKRSWVEGHPEYKKDFDVNKTYPIDKRFILMNPNSSNKFEFEKTDSQITDQNK